jgi:hypothetical protein
VPAGLGETALLEGRDGWGVYDAVVEVGVSAGLGAGVGAGVAV